MFDLFPNLQAEGFSETSPATGDYNCIAWAAGSTASWWWPDPLNVASWPFGVPREVTLGAFCLVFSLLDYEPCASGEHEAGFEKVAFYTLNGKPTHAARQLPDGLWTSKLGKSIDITHTLRGLEGDFYGEVSCFMKRQLQTSPPGKPRQPG
jgi:hypothetical protein